MGRPAKITVDAKKMDNEIKKILGARFNAARISESVLHKGKTYYNDFVKSGTISESALDTLCDSYGMDKDDYVITEEKIQEDIQQKAESQNYENLIVLLTGIDKSLRELLGQQKSTNYLLGELMTNSKETTKSLKERK